LAKVRPEWQLKAVPPAIITTALLMGLCYDRRMDRKTIAGQLALAERHVAEGRRHIEMQRNIVAGRERDGHDTALARRLLATLQDTQALHIGDRDRLRRELDRR